MLGSPPGHVKPTSSGHRGGVGAFINTVVPKFTHKIYIIFNFKKKSSNSNIDFYVSTLRRRANRGGIFSQIIFSQTNPCGSGILCNSNQNKRLSGRVFLSLFFLSIFGLLQKAKINCCFCTIYGIFPFSSQLLHIHVKTFYIYNIPGKIKLHTPWIFCHSSNTPVEL